VCSGRTTAEKEKNSFIIITDKAHLLKRRLYDTSSSNLRKMALDEFISFNIVQEHWKY
jgi:hypothetical protein